MLSIIKKINNASNLITNIKIELKLGGIKGLKNKIVEVSNRPIRSINNSATSTTDEGYKERIALEVFLKQQNEFTKKEFEDEINKLEYKPLISIIMPVYNVPTKWLDKAIESVENQYYKNWELCLVDDCSTDLRVRNRLKKHAETNKKINLKLLDENIGISGASNEAINLSSGEFLALMDNDDEITPDALYWIVKELNNDLNLDFIYSDECKIDDSDGGKLFEFVFKPEFSPETLMGFMYTGHFTVYRKELVKNIGGFRSQYDMAQDYDMALRVSQITDKIKHIERILYFWRAIDGSIAKDGKPRNINIAASIGSEIMNSNGYSVHTLLRPYGNFYRVTMDNNPLVSIIIPTDDKYKIINMINSLIQKTGYSNYEIILVTNSKLKSELMEEFGYLEKLNVIAFDKEFNFGRKCNLGSVAANGEILVFLQDKFNFLQSEWLTILVEHLELSKVGAISPKVVRGDGTIQYAGITPAVPGFLGLPFNGQDKDSYDCFWTRHRWVRDVSGLSASCIAIKKDIFNRVNKFEEYNLIGKFTNLDLSFKIIDSGLRCVYLPHSEIVNVYGNWWDSWSSNKLNLDKTDFYMMNKWKKYLIYDPYFTPSMRKTIMPEIDDSFKIFYPKVKIETGRKILLISHDLSLTGAPVALHYAAKTLLDNGDTPVVLSPSDGKMREELEKEGIMVIINPDISGESMKDFIKSFDLTIVNTLVNRYFITLLNDTNTPVIWWIHEAEESYKYIKDFPNYLEQNVHVYCGGDYAKEALKERRNEYNIDILHYSVPDHMKENIDESEYDFGIDKENCKIKFLIAGTIDKRKGQDIFIKAIKNLPDEYRKKCQFIFVGKKNDSKIYDDLLNAVTEYDEIVYIEELSRSKMIKLYSQVDSVVCPSRDDPMPIVMTESMIFSKICICSDRTGTASLIKNKINGLIVRNEDFIGLSEYIKFIIDNPIEAKAIGIKGRLIYENYFTEEVFKLNMIEIIDSILSNKEYN